MIVLLIPKLISESCNRIGLAYNPSMKSSFESSFKFRDSGRSEIPRSRFLVDVYEPIVAQYKSENVEVIDLGAIDIMRKELKRSLFYSIESIFYFYIFKRYCLILKSARNLNLQSGDVLVYVANEYSQGKANLKQACDTLIQRGIIILPVFVGTNVAVNELALLAESQKTGILKL